MASPNSFAKKAFLVSLAASLAVSLLAILLGLFKYAEKSNPTRYFGEGRFPTALSILQLLAAGVFCFLAYRRRRAAGARFGTGAAIWLAGAAGFLFLGLDEGLQIHENIDRWIHHTFIEGGKATDLTDRIDDLIVLAYGAVGALTLALCHKEVLRYRAAWPYVVFTVITAGLSIGFDALTNREDLISGPFHTWATVAEDVLKLVAEAGFIGAAAFVFAAALPPAENGP